MSSFATLPKSTSGDVKPYKIAIPPLKVRGMEILVQTSPVGPETFENLQTNRELDEDLGLNRNWFVEAKRKWMEEFRWEEQEKKINQLPQFMANIKDDDGKEFDVHFMGLFSEKQDAVPIVLFHGWPGSFLEFQKIFKELKTRYDNDPTKLPYHLIAPSLIGFGLSSKPPKDKNWTVTDTARIMNKLMIALGFQSGYIAQGGDIGSMVSQRLAQDYPECRAIHLNFLPILSPPDGKELDISKLSKLEQEGMERIRIWRIRRDAYAKEHGTRPATIGLVLSSSPVAMLAWIGEKFLEWTDQDLDIEEVLQSVSLYWLTECYPTSIYTYRDKNSWDSNYRNKPLGFSWFPKELITPPRVWVETKSDSVWFRAHESGGHFAAMEKPKELAQDIEDFVKETWPKVKNQTVTAQL